MTRGGKRKGAGPKPTGITRHKYATRLRMRYIRFLKRYGSQAKSQGKWIEEAIEHQHGPIDRMGRKKG